MWLKLIAGDVVYGDHAEHGGLADTGLDVIVSLEINVCSQFRS